MNYGERQLLNEALPLLRCKLLDELRSELANPKLKVPERVQFIKQVAAKLQYIDDIEQETAKT